MRRPKIFFIIFIILVFLTVGIIGILYSKKKSSEISESEWKVYRDTKYRFEIMYPKDWYVFSPSFFEKNTIVFSNLPKSELEKKRKTGDVYLFKITIINQKLEEWIAKQEMMSKILGIEFSKKEVMFGNIKGYKIIGQTSEGKKGSSLVFSKGDIAYLIETLEPKECQFQWEHKKCEIYKEMFSTFKFY